MEAQLKHPFPTVSNKGKLTYGGSQLLSHSKVINRCGCGVIAACDLFLYMHNFIHGCNCNLFSVFSPAQAIDVENYDEILNKLRIYFPLIPPFGINGFLLSLGINRFFNRYKYPYRATWCLSGSELWERIEYMLQRDLPVIISVGPNLPLFWQKHKTDMYSALPSGKMRKSTSVNAHFMSVTAIDDEWLTVSSWGRRYYISRCEYKNYVRQHSSSFVSNIVYIEKK